MSGISRMLAVTLGRVLDAEWVAGWAVAWVADLAGDPDEGLAVAAVAVSAGEIVK